MSRSKLGTICYALRMDVVWGKKDRGKIIPCKIITYERADGKILPVYRIVGEKRELDTNLHFCYSTLDSAIEALELKVKKS